MQSILKYKTEKRKDYESKAAVVMTDTYKKNLFRKQLQKSIKDRHKVVGAISNYAIIMRLRKFWIAHSLVQKMLSRAWEIGRERTEVRSVWTVQRIFRGFRDREKKKTLVIQAITAKENLKLHVAAKKVQKRLKGLLVRNRLKYLN